MRRNANRMAPPPGATEEQIAATKDAYRRFCADTPPAPADEPARLRAWLRYCLREWRQDAEGVARNLCATDREREETLARVAYAERAEGWPEEAVAQ